MNVIKIKYNTINKETGSYTKSVRMANNLIHMNKNVIEGFQFAKNESQANIKEESKNPDD
jgi:hypothetical protein